MACKRWARGSLSCVDLTTMTNDDLALFGVEKESTTPDPVALPIRHEQVESIRRAF